MELLRFHADLFSALSGVASVSDIAKDKQIDPEKWEAFRQVLLGLLPSLSAQCDSLDFTLAKYQADELTKALNEDKNTSETLAMIVELNKRILQYLIGRTVLTIPGTQARYYDNPIKGWESVLDKFPFAVENVEEASKCLAVGRSTACVFHLLGVVQDALEALAKKLAIKLDPYNDTWNGLINKIEHGLDAKRASVPKKTWKAIEPFYSELVSDIKAVKNAWRNPTMHFRRTYTDVQAQKIYARVQDLMVHASTRLHGKKYHGNG